MLAVVMRAASGRPHYANSPLTHAMIAVGFDPRNENVDFHAVGLAIKSVFEGLPVGEPEFIESDDEPSVLEGVSLSTSDGKSIVQVASNFCAALRLAPYEEWEVFLPRFLRLWDIMNQNIGVESVHYIAMRYTNQLKIESDEGVDRLLKFYPVAEHAVATPWRQAVATYKFSDLMSNLDMSIRETSGGNERNIVLDLSVRGSANLVEKAATDFVESLEIMHEKIGEAFEMAITDVARERFA